MEKIMCFACINHKNRDYSPVENTATSLLVSLRDICAATIWNAP